MGLAARIRTFMGMPEDEYYEEDAETGAVLEPDGDEAYEDAPCCEVVLTKPERFDEASGIADHLSANRMIVLNLENTQRDTARRLIDFLGGAVYAKNGMLNRVAENVFLITPFNVEYLDPQEDPAVSIFL